MNAAYPFRAKVITSAGSGHATGDDAAKVTCATPRTGKPYRRLLTGGIVACVTSTAFAATLGLPFSPADAYAPASPVSANVAISALADGLSYVDPNVSYANLRSCPSVPSAGEVTGCGPVDQLPGGASVRMICWTVGNPPSPGSSAKWFWVEESAGGRNPGWRGYVWSDLVWDQTDVPYCDDLDPSVIGYYTDNYPDSDGDFTADTTTGSAADSTTGGSSIDSSIISGTSQVSLNAGPAAPSGFRYAVSVSGFTPGSVATVGCFDSVDSLSPFYVFDVTIDGNGNGYVDNQCYSGDGPYHWVSVDGVFSSTVAW